MSTTDLLLVFPSVPSISPPPTIRAVKLSKPCPSISAFEIAFDLNSKRPAGVDDFILGELGSDVEKGIRLTRDKLFWLTPTPSLDLPTHLDTQLLLLQLPAAKYQYAAVLPLTTAEYMGTLRGGHESEKRRALIARFERDAGEGGRGKVVVCLGYSVKSVVAGAVEAMETVRGGGKGVLGETMSDLVDAMKNMTGMASRDEEHLFSDTLTYCTWNSLFPPVPKTSTSVLRTLEHFSSVSIFPTTLLLDDAWQSVNDLRLASFAIGKSFLDGLPSLESLVKKVKTDFGIQRVGCWHTIGGYWQGVDPSAFYAEYQLVKVTKDGYPGPGEPEGFSYYLPHPSDVGRFFDAYYAYMHSSGITFTKCDNMASLDALVVARQVTFPRGKQGFWEEAESLGEDVDIPGLRTAFKEAVKAAASKYFGGSEGGGVIWCMEMSPRVLLGKEIGGSTGRRSIIRNSDDYYPDHMDSHRYHIYTNALNATFTSHLNVIPDLDMFQSHTYIAPNSSLDSPVEDTPSPQAEYHAALRALSAGPVTITDVVGRTNAHILSKLLGQRKKGGRSIVLQAQKTFTIGDNIFDNVVGGGEGRGLRIWSEAPQASAGSLGIWNTRSGEGKVVDRLEFADIVPLTSPSPERTLYSVYSYLDSSLHLADHSSQSLISEHDLAVRLPPFGFNIFTVSPFLSSPGPPFAVQIACIGLVDKYNSLAALVEPPSFDEEGRFCARFKCSGTAGFVFRREPGAAGSSNVKAAVKGSLAEVRRSWKGMGELLEVDLSPYLSDDDEDFAVTLHV